MCNWFPWLGNVFVAFMLGEGTPEPIHLWPGKPPKFAANAPAETGDAHAGIRMISVATLSAHLPPKGKGIGPGGGYGARGWKTHVVYAADSFVPKGIAVIAGWHAPSLRGACYPAIANGFWHLTLAPQGQRLGPDPPFSTGFLLARAGRFLPLMPAQQSFASLAASPEQEKPVDPWLAGLLRS